jgi:hypothetical protein
MPEEEPQVAALVEAIEQGADTIAVPEEMLQEAEDAAPVARSLYAQIVNMGIAEKLKLALRGNRDARAILARDGTKLIRRMVLQNPRITDTEVIAIARNRSTDEEMLRIITDRKEWIRNYQVRLAIATNPKTPLALALKQVATLMEHDLRQLAKSKNVSQTVVAQVRRVLSTTRGGS